MKNFTLRWGIYKRQQRIKDTDNFMDHVRDYLKWCQRQWADWEYKLGNPRWTNTKERNGKFNEWLELVYKVNT